MTFHTFEVSTYLTGTQCHTVNNSFKKYGHLYYKDSEIENRKIFEGLRNKGIVIYLYKRDTDDSRFVYHLSYRVNPTRMFDSDDYVNLFHANHVGAMIEQFDKVVSDCSPALPQFNECSLARFDFCSNVILPDAEAVAAFIKLINQSAIPCDRYKQKMKRDTRAGRYVFPKEEATFKHEDYVEISFYNKIHQLESERFTLDWNTNILRCEVRCYKMYINTLMRKFEIKTAEEFLYYLPEIGTYVFSMQFKNLNLSHRWYRLREIEKTVDSRPLKNKWKKRLKNFAQSAAMHKGIQNINDADDLIHAGKSIKKLADMNICAMPLPCRCPIESETSLLDLCLEYADAKSIADTINNP